MRIMVIFLKIMFSALIMRFIWQKKKQKTLNVGKIRIYDGDKVFFVFFFRKKRFHLSKLHLYQIGKAQNMPMVAGRLVAFSSENEAKLRCSAAGLWAILEGLDCKS